MKAKYGKESRELMLSAIEFVAKAVKSTLGGGGRTVMIESPYPTQKPIVTKDGVSVARAIETNDKELAVGINFIKEVAIDTNNEAGDGTTTSIVLAEAFARYSSYYLDKGVNPRELTDGFNLAVRIVLEYLKEVSVSVMDNTELLKQVAITSANNDVELGTLVYDAFNAVNFEGVVQLAPEKNVEDGFEVANGTRFARGFVSPVGMNNMQERMFDYENCNILITDHLITDLMDFQNKKGYNVLNDLADASTHDDKDKRKPLLLICDDMETAAIVRMSQNVAQGAIRAVVVKCPDYGSLRDNFLSDLAMNTGGRYISTKLGHKLSDITMDDIGSADAVQVSRDFTLIKGGHGDQEKVREHVDQLIQQLQHIPKEDKPDLEKRISNITGGVAEIKVGASSDSELGEKRDRVEDAINAVRSAYEEGIVAGGGSTLLRGAYQRLKLLFFDGFDKAMLEDEYTPPTFWTRLMRKLRPNKKVPKVLPIDSYLAGFVVAFQGFKAPFQTILENAGIEDVDKKEKLIGYNKKTELIFNVLTQETEDFKQSMIIDPVKVTRCAVENAASVVRTLISTDAIVYRPEKAPTSAEDVMIG